jgi:hypothetical protein
MTMSYILTLVCAYKLIEVRKIVNKISYSEIAYCAYGSTGKITAEIAIAVS